MNLDLIKGIGPKTKTYLNKLNINNVDDLLEHYPFRYEIINITNQLNSDFDKVYIIGKIVTNPILNRFGRMNSLKFKFETNNKVIDVIIFNRGYLKNKLSMNKVLTLSGKYNFLKNSFVANNLMFGAIKDKTIIPVYHLTNGLKEVNLKKYIKESFDYINDVTDFIPEYYSSKYKFITKKDALEKIHYPKDLKEIKEAKVRLIYEELFKFMFKINYLKETNKEKKSEIKKIKILEKEKFIKNLSFELTKSQIKAIDEIFEDLTSTKRMNRLIMGDVGSGKTVISLAAVYLNFKAGYQSALMAPTEILASQHYKTALEILKPYNIKTELLTGSMTAKEKNKIMKDLEEGKIDLIIGTHTLIGEKIKFNNLGLVITDEQHRFGVRQRKNLRNKGEITDILYMSATPIPRTFALTIYGDMDITKITEKPKGRKSINTIIKSKKEIKDILYLMLEEIKKGRQVFIVCPLVNENENLELTDVINLKDNIDKAYNNKIKTEIMHGKLKKQEKESVMQDFVDGKTKILISTTVIEVGVDVKNATMIVIFDAEMFGLATLHQLRGRIGRNDYDSTCILVGSKNNKRLKVLEESDDGFYISEADFEQRGEGEIFGEKQSGEIGLKIANLKRDYKILLKAKEDSEEYLKSEIVDGFNNDIMYKKIVDEIKTLD